jgi:hypothetical protein
MHFELTPQGRRADQIEPIGLVDCPLDPWPLHHRGEVDQGLYEPGHRNPHTLRDMAIRQGRPSPHP